MTYSLSLADLESELAALVVYLGVKVTARDWHGVSDAAMDIREVEAKISVLKHIDSQPNRG